MRRRYATSGLGLLGLALPTLAGTPCGAQTAPGRLTTRWAAAVTADRILPEYPRPQLVRPAWQSLNGRWDYAIRDSGASAPARAGRFDGTILVPFPIESQLSGVQRAVTDRERLWYRRRFRVAAAAPGSRWLLHFGAVDWAAVVYVNGRRIGEHSGGYDPFSFDITAALRPTGDQELVVGVRDPTDRGDQPRGKQVLKPGSIWYTAVTGIWQTVWLEPVPATYVSALQITPDVDASTVTIRAVVSGAEPGARVRAVARAGDSIIARGEGAADAPLTLRLPQTRLWSPDDPFLYGLSISLSGGDSIESYFGMRTIAVAPDRAGALRLVLNGRPLFQYGTLDQGWWPDGLYTAPTDEALRSDVETLKRLGFNLIRKHVKVEPDRWYYHCDRLGMLVWQDMPSANNTTADGRRQFAAELGRVVDALRNHPAIVMWVPFNEGWGQHDTERYVAWLKQHDPTRLVNSASGWLDTGVGDVVDMHDYPGPASPPRDSARARVLGEFGGLGLPLAGHVWQSQGSWGYRTYPDTLQLAAAYRDVVSRLGFLVAHGLAAAVYTQTTDVEIEVNGLLTYDRAVVKLPPEAAQWNRRLYELSDREAPAMAGARVRREPFGQLPSGPGIEGYTLTNANGMAVRVLTYGGILQAIRVPDRSGQFGDVVLGHDSLAGYLRDSPYFGALIGRYGNRIAKGTFTLDGRVYRLATNNSPNHIHGGVIGFDKVVWQAEPFERDREGGVVLTHTSPDGDEGYPGTLVARVTYTLTDGNELIVDYQATTDRPTLVNLTQHSYFNLTGGGARDVLGHELEISADRFTPVDATLIPTGALTPVAGTPFDFRTPVALGARIEQPDAQLRAGGGYDHNFVLNRPGPGLFLAARVFEPTTGRTLEVRTTEPGLQFYSGNFLDGTIAGKGGRVYARRSGLCLETQHFPDSPNHPDFPTTILRPGERYRSRTVFTFGVR
jgi:galactose mutarotase-like enzyme